MPMSAWYRARDTFGGRYRTLRTLRDIDNGLVEARINPHTGNVVVLDVRGKHRTATVTTWAAQGRVVIPTDLREPAPVRLTAAGRAELDAAFNRPASPPQVFPIDAPHGDPRSYQWFCEDAACIIVGHGMSEAYDTEQAATDAAAAHWATHQRDGFAVVGGAQ